MKSCNDCSFFKIINEGYYSTFECTLIKSSDIAYGQVMRDIGWNNYRTNVSEKCPRNRETNGRTNNKKRE